MNRTPVCTEAFAMESEGVERGNVGLRGREVKNYKLGGSCTMRNPRGLANWCLSKLGSYPSQRQGTGDVT